MENINHYKLFFNNITSASVICEVFVDIDGNPIDLKIIDMNVCFETMLKSSKADLLGKTLTELNLVQNKQRMKEILDGALKGNSYTDEIYVESTNKYIKITAFQLEKGQCAILADDVTNNKKTEEALKESEERYRNFFQSANEGIFDSAMKENELKFRSIFQNSPNAISLTKKGEIIIVNDSFIKMFGYDKVEELLGEIFCLYIIPIAARLSMDIYKKELTTSTLR